MRRVMVGNAAPNRSGIFTQPSATVDVMLEYLVLSACFALMQVLIPGHDPENKKQTKLTTVLVWLAVLTLMGVLVQILLTLWLARR